MLINHDNYETIFLLYVDNELSVEERRVVEEFVNANQELREELEVLQSTVLPADDAVFVPKTQLYKNATPVESVQESLLLMLDNELADKYKSGLLQQINQSSEVKDEWLTLQKTVLDKNDLVVFQHKKSLYRHTTRVVPMKLWRVAAAILIGIGLFTGITLYNNNNVATESPTALTTPVGKPSNEPVEKIKMQPIPEEKKLLAAENQVRQTQATVVENDQVLADKQEIVISKSRSVRDEVVQKNTAPVAGETTIAKQEKILEKNTVSPLENRSEEIAVTESPVKAEITNPIINDSDVGQTRNTFARLAVNDEDPDRFLNISEDKVTRTKLGGILRQVKRVVERKTKINTSNGLRIGGFEIAIK